MVDTTTDANKPISTLTQSALDLKAPLASPTLTGTVTTSGQLVSSRANNVADGQGQLYLNGTIGNRIDFNYTGIAVPSLNTRSLGTKLVLFPSVSTSTADFAIGVELGAVWNSIGDTTSAFKWYTNATNIATLSGNGNFKWLEH